MRKSKRNANWILFTTTLALSVTLFGVGCPITEDATTDGDSTPLTAIQVETLTGAANEYYDIYRKTTGASVDTYAPANEPVEVPPGVYVLTEYFNDDFVYDNEVIVEQDATTTVTLGGIKLVTVTNASDGAFDIYNATGATAYATYNDPDVIVTAPAGTFTLKEYFNNDFTYASNVQVTAGALTTVTMGGIKLVTVAGAVEGEYAVYDETGTTVYVTRNDPDVVITAPAGTFTLKEYYNDDFTYASNVVVTAGATTTVTMVAIRYNGTLAYDIYTGGALVSTYNDAGAIVTAPPGTYTLTEYYDDQHVLATSVVVTAGNITDVN